MLTNVDVGWTVIYNDHTGFPCPALVTKVYTPGDPNSDLDLHVIGIKGNAAFARGKIQVTYGVATTGSWEYQSTREIRIAETDLPTDGQGLVYNDTADIFETETLSSSLVCIDGGTF